VRVVDIDEASLAEQGQWPWPRTTLAKLSTRLMELGASTVAFDIVFPEPDRLSPRRVLEALRTGDESGPTPVLPDATTLPDNDETFAHAITGQPVVLAFAAAAAGHADATPLKGGFAQTGLDALQAPKRIDGILSNIPALNMAAAGLGGINIDLAKDEGITRQVPAIWSDGSRYYPSLAIEALRVAQGADTIIVNASQQTENAIETLRVGDIELPLNEAGMFHMYFRPDAPDLYVSAKDVLDGTHDEALKEKIEGNIVFVGTSAVGLLDVRTSPLGQSIPGVSVHAQMLEQVLSGSFLTRPEWAAGAEMLGSLLLGLLLSLAATLLQPRNAFLVFTASAIAMPLAAIFAFRNFGLLVDSTFPVLASALTFFLSLAYRLLVTDRDGRRLRNAFRRYVAGSVLSEIERNPQSLKLGGEMRDVTVMFVDVENFTPLSEKLAPTDLVTVINRILDAGSKAILAERGTIDKYIGDAIMAFWNAPLPVKDHQACAARAALGVRKAVLALNDDPAISGLLSRSGAPRLGVRVGIASGPACVGNMGSEERFDYSVLGETVNTAARTESAGKELGYGITIAGSLTDETRRLALLPAGSLPMKGKSRREPVHIVVGDEHAGQGHAFATMRTAFAQITGLPTMGSGKKLSAAATDILLELADQHPELKDFFERIPGRLDDYRAG
jgi:adenylate cyclase